jgi:hypothetical protein
MRPILAILSVITTSILITAAQARDYAIPPMPDLPTASWDVGSSVTHSVRITQGEEDSQCNLRMAVLGTEHEAATDTSLYWVEFDITAISGLDEELETFFIEQYGETPDAIRMNMLIPQYDLTRFFLDPSGVYRDFSEFGFVRKLYFQYNRLTPFDVEPSLIGGFFLPLAAGMLLESDLPENFRTERNLGITLVKSPEAFVCETSHSEMATPAGVIEGTMFSFTSTDASGASGLLFFSDDIPILPCVSYTSDWTGSSRPGHIEAELIEFQNENAKTDIVGRPERFDLTTLMYGTQGSS